MPRNLLLRLPRTTTALIPSTLPTLFSIPFLPPPLPLRKPYRRTIHTTPHPSFLEPCFEQTYHLLAALHQLTGLSWVSTLPLAGAGIRIFVVGPLTLASHITTRRRLALQPLRHAWSHQLKHQVFAQHAASGPAVCQRIWSRALKQKTKEIDARMGTQRWKDFLPWAQVPVFLLVIETIRKMSGVHDGLLGLLAKALRRAAGSAEIIADRNLLLAGEGEGGGGGLEEQGLPLSIDTPSLIPTISSFTSSGALWFPNLLLPDPLSILPFLLSSTLLANIILQRRRSPTQPSKWGRRYLNAMTVLAVLVGPLTLQLPAAMHVYWLSTSTLAIAQNLLLEKYWPRQTPIIPCAARERRAMLGSGGNSRKLEESR